MDAPRFFFSGSDMADRINRFDWSLTSLGPIASWADGIRAIVEMILQSPLPIVTLWGEPGVMIYNDAYSVFAGGRHPRLLGSDVRDGWPEVADFNDYVIKTVFRKGETLSFKDQELVLDRGQGGQKVWLDLDYSPIFGENRKPLGVIAFVIETTGRVIAQETIKASEAQFRSFAQSVPNHVWTAPPNGLLDWFNERVTEYSGWRHEELVGDRWAEIVHPDDRDSAALSWQQAVTLSEPYETEFRVRRHDGEYRWHLVRALPICDTDGTLMRWIGTNTDIHDQKLAKAEAAKDRNRLWSLSQELMLVCDYQGVITAINPSAERLLGWTEAEMIGHTLTEFLHQDDRAQTTAALQKLASGAATLAFENRYRTKAGAFRLFAWTVVADSDRIHGVGRDVTEERAISRDNERIWNLSPVLKVVASVTGVVSAVNPSWNKVLGWSVDETIGRHILDFVAAEDRDAVQNRIRMLASGEPIKSSFSTLLTKDGFMRRIAWTAVPEGDKIYAFGRDITAEIEASEALAVSEAALRQAQKMDAVGQLTGGIAHDFNNLLQVVSGNLQLLAKDTEGNERAARRLQAAQEGVARGSRLAAQLLAFGRRQPLAPRVVNLGRLVRSMDDMLRRALGETIEIETIVAGGLWNTLVDQGNVENVLLNLAINARDAMESGGKLTIETGNAFLDQTYARMHPDITPGQYVLLAVTDTGCGIPQELVEKVFDPFFSTKPEGKGTGLGLSMVYGFVKQSGGHVKIYSELGEGTTIKIYLPRSTQAEEDIVVRYSGLIEGGSETILVVEDDKGVRDTVIEILSDLGYKVLQASDAQSALAIIESGVPIDLLFTDVVMPGPLKSTQLARMAVERLPNLAVLFTSGYTENSIVHAGRLDEGVELLSKPYTTEALALRLRHQLDGRANRQKSHMPPLPVAKANRTLKVLLCEDDFLIRMATNDMLADLGHTVLEADTAQSALQILSQNTIDLLLTDIGLPDMLGTSLVKKAREIQPCLPVIYATGHIATQGMDLDENTHAVTKPYASGDLEHTIKKLFREKQ
ncbi:PAS domain S-box protein [Cypionkella sp.]|uniref:PAS domain S-box protein n=1 Tax=Cypionkella sp. TaxID=2811411 RepID=UPI002633A664|nr:PAS domain S-box protein [Cypionkella sp.]MDB5664864.1 hybrid sensor histidine kinase/response regulator [Cypionkella sp.]